MPKERDDRSKKLKRRSRRDDDSVERYRNRRRSWSCSSSDDSNSTTISRNDLARLKRLADDLNWNKDKSMDRSPVSSSYSRHKRESSRSSPQNSRGPIPSAPVKKCHFCESYNHMKDKCPLKGIKRCYGCAQLGHTRPECPLPLSKQRDFGWHGNKIHGEETRAEGTRNRDDCPNEYRREVCLKEIETRRSISPQRTTTEQRENKRRRLDHDSKWVNEKFEKRQREIDEQKRALFEEERKLKKEKAQFEARKREVKTKIQKKEIEIRQARATLIKLEDELELLEIEYEQFRTTPIRDNVLRKRNEKYLPPKKSPMHTNQLIVNPPPPGVLPETTHIASEDQWAWHVLNFVKNT